MRRGGWANRPLFWGLLGIGSVIVACGSRQHDCIDTRSCVAPIGFIDAGIADDWWDAGAGAGGSELSTPDGEAAGAGGNEAAGAGGNEAAGAGGSNEAGASPAPSALRQVSVELVADPARTGNWTDGEGEGVHNCLRKPPLGYLASVCVGDDSANVRYTGFISFDLSALPANVREFSSARLLASGSINGNLRALGASSLEHVAFGELGQAALTTPADASFGAFFGSAQPAPGSDVELSVDVTAAVARDYSASGGTLRLSQYRLKFNDVSANGIWDDVELTTSELRLSLVYLVP